MEFKKPPKCCGCAGSKCGCNPEEYCSDVPEITLADLKNKLASEQFLLINVLDPEYFQDCHIPTSVNIPLKDLEEKIKSYDKNQPIITYCASYECLESDKAYKTLKKLGFKNVHVYKGGIKEWKESGQRCEGPMQKALKKL